MSFARAAKSEEYERIFLSRYDQFRKLAVRIANFDRDTAEDIVHDAFIRFISNHRSPDNFESYIFVSLKNQYATHLRRNARQRVVTLSVLDDAIANSSTYSFDPRPANRTLDKLRAICQYACLRRETSIGASILILRFFHGFSAEEVVRVIRRSANAIECRLAMARREMNTFLAFPHELASVAKNGMLFDSSNSDTTVYPHIQEELRQLVFANRLGDCPPPGAIRGFYEVGSGELPKHSLAHLVGCEECLAATTEVLEL